MFEEKPETFLAQLLANVASTLKPYVDTEKILIRQFGRRDAVSRTVGTKAVQTRVDKVVVLDSLTGYFNAMAEEGVLVEPIRDL